MVQRYKLSIYLVVAMIMPSLTCIAATVQRLPSIASSLYLHNDFNEPSINSASILNNSLPYFSWGNSFQPTKNVNSSELSFPLYSGRAWGEVVFRQYSFEDNFFQQIAGYRLGYARHLNKLLAWGFYGGIDPPGKIFYYNLAIRSQLPQSYKSKNILGVHNLSIGISLTNLREDSYENANHTAHYAFLAEFLRYKMVSFSFGSGLNFDWQTNAIQSGIDLNLELWKTFSLYYHGVGNDIFQLNQSNVGAMLKYENDWWQIKLGLYNQIRNNDWGLDLKLGVNFMGSVGANSGSSSNKSSLTIFLEPSELFTPDGDGINDQLKIHLFHRSIEKTRDWNIVIKNSQEKIIKILHPNIFQQDKDGLFDFPKLVFWNGLDYNNTIVADGKYSLSLSLIDKNKEKWHWPLGLVIVDTKMPDFNFLAESSEVYFSEGENLILLFKDNFNDIDYYFIEFLDSKNEVIYATNHKSTAEREKFSWSGKIARNEFIPSGIYNVRISAFDFAKNKITKEIIGVHLHSVIAAARTSIPQRIFSPGKNELPIYLKSVHQNNIKNWKLTIFSQKNRNLIKAIDGQNYLPEKISWNGKDQNQKPVPSGNYLANLEIQTLDGSLLSSDANFIQIDKFNPFVTINTNKRVFTPDEDGYLDSLQVSVNIHDDSVIKDYRLRITNEKNEVVRDFYRTGQPPPVIFWNGVLDTGHIVQSFEKYFIQLIVSDMAGNVGESNTLAIETSLCVNSVKQKIDLGKPELLLRFSNIEFGLGSDIPNKNSLLILNKVAVYLGDHPNLKISITGHTDNIGSRDQNIQLSQKRAEFVRQYLIDNIRRKDIEIHAFGKGPDEPVFENTNDFFRSKNRRVEFKIEKLDTITGKVNNP